MIKLRNRKTGEIGYLHSGSDNSVQVARNSGYNYRYYDTLTELIAEWEDVPEPKGYWYIRDDGSGVGFSPLDNSTVAQRRSIIGNYFESEEEAEKAVEWLKARKVLFDDAKGFKPDWRNTEQFKWSVYYVPGEDEDEDEDEEGIYSTNINTAVNDIPGPYFATKEDAMVSIREHEKEWMIYLGVEE